MKTRIYAAPAVKGLTLYTLSYLISILTLLKLCLVPMTQNFERAKIIYVCLIETKQLQILIFFNTDFIPNNSDLLG